MNSADSKRDKQKLEEKLYQTSNETSYTINKNYKWLIAAVVLFVIVLLVLVKVNSLPVDDDVTKLIALVPNIFISAIISWSCTTILKTIVIEKRVSITKQFSPQDFSDEFRKIVDDKKDFSVYVIDDIDRCTNSQILEILETIHGFLKGQAKSISNYVFLIPIDKQRIYSVLGSERNYDEHDSNEYFNKLFDVIINIDNPEKQNMFEMIKSINDEYEYNLTSMSISLLSDFLVKTPREIKRNLNELNLYRSILKQKKEMNYIKATSLIDIDQIVKLFVLRKNWEKIYYTVLEMTIKGENADYTLLRMSKEEGVQDSFLNFVRLSLSVSIGDIRSFEYLKDTEVNLSEGDVSLVSSGNLVELNERFEDGFSIEEIINVFSHTYRKYIEERNLFAEFAIPLFCVYVWILSKGSDSHETQLTNRVKVDVILSLTDHHYDECLKSSRLDAFNLTTVPITDLIEYKSESKNTIDIIEKFSYYTIETKQYELIFDLLMQDKKTDFFENETRESLLDVLIKNWKPDYDKNLAPLIEDTNLFDMVYNQANIDIFVEEDSRYLLAVIAKENSELLNDKYSKIIDNSTIKEIISAPLHSSDKDYFEKISVLPFLMNFYNEDNFWRDFNDTLSNINISQLLSSIVSVEKNEETVSFMNNLLKLFFSHRASDYPYTKKIQIDLSVLLANSEYIDNLNSAIESSTIEGSIKFEYLFLLLSKTNFNNKVIDTLIELINHNTDQNEINQVNDVLKKIYSSTGNSNHTLNYFNITVTLSKQYYLTNLFPKIITLINDRFIDIIKFTNLQTIFASSVVFEFIKERRKNVELYGMLIDKIVNIDEYKTIISFVSRGTHGTKLHLAMDRLLDNVSSLNELLNLHDIASISSVELNKIKRVKLEKFPTSSTSGFTKIGWSEQEIQE